MMVEPTPRGHTQAAADFVFFALSRAGYGPRPGEAAEIARTGFAGWVEAQLHPDDAADTACQERLKTVPLAIRYAAGNGLPDGGGVLQAWPACDEQRPLTLLDKPIEALWPLFDRATAMDYTERRRPRDELIAARILRAVHSRWQLREVMADFWHDHFHVDAYANEQTMVAMPVYDREVIRANVFGNFRAMMEAVACSAAMQCYLSNRSSRAGSANENYARELFELHTLGREVYLNDRYDHWRDVPGAVAGKPSGYIDQDVYEAARAFTGWTIEDGSRIDGRTVLPKTGRFVYVESWHDGYQKRVLGTEFDPFQKAMADGRKVLDLLADHPATARFVCTKLCARFIADVPPHSAVAKAEAAWHRYRTAPDQIGRVVQVILLSPEFAAARGAKVRRPLALTAAFARATGLDLAPTEALANEIANAGERLFGWPAPNGQPDAGGYYLTTNGLRRRWELVIGLADNAWKNGQLAVSPEFAAKAPTPRGLVAASVMALSGARNPATEYIIVASLGLAADAPMTLAPADFARKAARVAAYVALSPQFQTI